MQQEREKGGITGTVIIRSHPAGTVEQLEALHRSGRHDDANAILKIGKIEVTQKNMIVWSLNCGFDILVQYLLSAYAGSLAMPLGIAWGEIGTGSTTPANTDTALTTPTNRTPVSYAADNQYNEAQVEFFLADGILANGTYTEFGSFVGGTSTIGTGNMFNHALFSTPYSKSSGVDTTLQILFDFSN